MASGSVCPKCRCDTSAVKTYPGTLPMFSTLKNRYIVGRVLGKGGFGITYTALDMNSNKRVAIKEYMPGEYSVRSNGTATIVPKNDDKSKRVFEHGLQKYIEEAGTLVTLRENRNIVDILDYFSENNTGYIVMEFLDGDNYNRLARNNGGLLGYAEVFEMFRTLSEALAFVHKKGILHRDISPENVIRTKDGRIKLIDFGAARSYVAGENKGMSVLLKVSYAPYEQYSSKGNQGPWTDVYSACATVYHLISGKKLPDISIRKRERPRTLSELGAPVPQQFSRIIQKGLEYDIPMRYQNFEQLLADLYQLPDPNGSKKQVEINPPADPPQREFWQKQTPPAQPPKQPQPLTPKPPIISEPKPPVQPTPPTPKPPVQPAPLSVRQPAGGTVWGRPQVRQNGGKKAVGYLINVATGAKCEIPAGGEVKAGRSSSYSNFVIDPTDQNLSRAHMLVRFDGESFFVTDNSQNGTYLESGIRLPRGSAQRLGSGIRLYAATPNHMLMLLKE